MSGLAREVWEETGLRVKSFREDLREGGMVWDLKGAERERVMREEGGDGEVKFEGKRGDCEFFLLVLFCS